MTKSDASAAPSDIALPVGTELPKRDTPRKQWNVPDAVSTRFPFTGKARTRADFPSRVGIRTIPALMSDKQKPRAIGMTCRSYVSPEGSSRECGTSIPLAFHDGSFRDASSEPGATAGIEVGRGSWPDRPVSAAGRQRDGSSVTRLGLQYLVHARCGQYGSGPFVQFSDRGSLHAFEGTPGNVLEA